MNTHTYQSKSHISPSDLTKTGIITALYVTVTFALSVISFGAIQLRFSEMFNYLALFHKRYLIAITFGVVIVNFVSLMCFLYVPIAGTATFLVLILSRYITKNIKNLRMKFAINGSLSSLSMFTVESQLYIVFGVSSKINYITTVFGELISMRIGGIIVFIVYQILYLT